jgi:hypothetical protein
MWQTASKMSASRAAATIAATQTTDAKKKRKRTGPIVSADTVTVSSDVETIYIEEEDNTKSPGAATTVPAEMPRKVAVTEDRAVETSGKVVTAEKRSRSGTDILGDVGSQKRARKAPPKPIKLGLRSASK